MKQPIVTAGLLALSLAATPVAADSVMEERFREEGRQLDLTGFFQAETDAHSRSFLFGGANAHDFSVTEAGTYLFESRVTAGYSEDYRIAAVLEDAQGQVIARSEALGQNGGLALRQRLAPGDYVLRVEAQRFGTRGRAGDGYSINIVGLDEQGQRLAEGVSDGEGIFFTGDKREGARSVFVKGDEAVATLGGSAETAADAGEAAATASTSEPGTAGAAGVSAATSGAAAAATQASREGGEAEPVGEPASRQGYETIVTDVKIRARGEVLTFEMAEQGSVAITTSTYPTGYEDTYRIALEVLDASGRVVAEGAGQGFDGDVDLETMLSPGRYRIRVQGQKFGSAHSGVNNYELRVERRR
ncbi:hypothetical protein [Halomonas nitroreducens]|uniref:ABC transporter substrate-binding protein n=1 Tax=Halomonas nitroreducens TaxID=447425 RepID=A0A3S0JZI0_9GAMM|nr:hypothetical protein [Halomonas nitroreducens]RTR07215.1 hypothetical protein EKG36_01840 [Halomonas nitroreducens]